MASIIKYTNSLVSTFQIADVGGDGAADVVVSHDRKLATHLGGGEGTFPIVAELEVAVSAVGRAGVEGLDIAQVEIWLGEVCIVRNGGRDPGYSEPAGQEVMQRPELRIGVRLGRGKSEARVLTCDLSYDYVRINAEYRT